MQKLLLITAFLTLTTQVMTAQTLQGPYMLTGVREMAAGFMFTPDGRFEFFYSYGAGDRMATGKYSLEGNILRIISDKVPGKDFTVTKESKKGNGYTITIRDPNSYLTSYVKAYCFVGDTREEYLSNDQGVISFDTPHCDRIFLRHELFPDYPSLIKDEQNINHHFEVKLNPSLGQVSFKDIEFTFEDGEITCQPNYFMPFSGIRFVKE